MKIAGSCPPVERETATMARKMLRKKDEETHPFAMGIICVLLNSSAIYKPGSSTNVQKTSFQSMLRKMPVGGFLKHFYTVILTNSSLAIIFVVRN